jgi:hypothetical protein
MGLFEFVVANEYVCNVTLPTQVIKYNQCCSRWISQSDCSIHIWLNYILFNNKIMFTLKWSTKAEFIFHPILMQILAKWSYLWVTDGLCNNFCYFILKKDLRAQIPKFLIFGKYTEFLFFIYEIIAPRASGSMSMNIPHLLQFQLKQANKSWIPKFEPLASK